MKNQPQMVHFSEFITEATIIGSSSYTEKLEIISFKKNFCVFVVILNRYIEIQNCHIRCSKKILNVDIPGNSISIVPFKNN